MSLAVVLVDETTDGKKLHRTELKLVSERVTLREIIASRIKQEIDKHNSQKDEMFFGLVRPTDTEASLNGYKLRKPRTVSYEKQFEKAITAFENNGFFVLLNNKQIEALDEPLILTEDSEISFVKLVQLIGG